MIKEDLERAELIGMLRALSSHMIFVSDMLRKYRLDKSGEMKGAAELCIEWANSLDDEIFDCNNGSDLPTEETGAVT